MNTTEQHCNINIHLIYAPLSLAYAWVGQFQNWRKASLKSVHEGAGRVQGGPYVDVDWDSTHAPLTIPVVYLVKVNDVTHLLPVAINDPVVAVEGRISAKVGQELGLRG